MVEIHVSSFSLRILALFGLLTYFFKHLRKILNLQSSFTIKHEPTQWVKSPKKQSELTRTHSFRLLFGNFADWEGRGEEEQTVYE